MSANLKDMDRDYLEEFIWDLEATLKYLSDVPIVDEDGGLRLASEIMDDFTKKPKKNDVAHELVNHPDHYNEGSIECIEAMRRMYGDEAVKNFCNLTAFKYYFRRGNKVGENFDRDTKKAEWYLDYMKKLPEKKNYVNVNWGAMK